MVKAVRDEVFDEGHCKAVLGVVRDIPNLDPWLTTEQAQTELVAEVLGKHRGSTGGIKPTVVVVREAARRWKALITAAETAYSSLDEAWRPTFVKELADAKARSEADVQRALARVSAGCKAAKEKAEAAARAAVDETATPGFRRVRRDPTSFA